MESSGSGATKQELPLRKGDQKTEHPYIVVPRDVLQSMRLHGSEPSAVEEARLLLTDGTQEIEIYKRVSVVRSRR